jgi:hypothetical protein
MASLLRVITNRLHIVDRSATAAYVEYVSDSKKRSIWLFPLLANYLPTLSHNTTTHPPTLQLSLSPSRVPSLPPLPSQPPTLTIPSPLHTPNIPQPPSTNPHSPLYYPPPPFPATLPLLEKPILQSTPHAL